MHGLTHDEDHGYMLADQDVGIQYSETVLDSVIDDIFKDLTVKIALDLFMIT